MKSAQLHKGFSAVLVVIVVALAAVALGGYLFLNGRANSQVDTTSKVTSTPGTNNSTETTSDWVFLPQQEELYDFTFKYDANKYKQWKSSPYDLAWVSKNPDGEDVPDSIMVKCAKTPLIEYPGEKTEAKTIKLGSKDASYYKADGTNSPSGQSYAVAEFQSGVGYCRFIKNITISGESEEFDLILSTFRFT